MRTRCMVGRVVSAFLALAIPAAAATAGPLPRIAVSLPAGVSPAEIVRAVQACGGREVLVVLPPVNARIGGASEAPRGVETAVLQAGPSPATGGTPVRLARAYVHLRVEVGDVSATGREREVLVERQVADIVRALALDAQPVAGLVVEPIGAAASNDLLQFALAMLIIKARAAKPNLEVALVLPDRTDAGPGGADLQRPRELFCPLLPRTPLRSHQPDLRVRRGARTRAVLGSRRRERLGADGLPRERLARPGRNCPPSSPARSSSPTCRGK